MTKLYLFLTAVLVIVLGGWYYLHNNIKTMTIQNYSSDSGVKQNKDTFEPTEKNSNIDFPETDGATYFNVPVGGNWIAINDNWSIRLVEVVSDDRCPTGVACETSGWAKAKVQFMQPNVDYAKAYYETLEVSGLNRWPMPMGELKPTLLRPLDIVRADAVTGKSIGFRITLADLSPYPDKKHYEELPKNYVGLFKIELLK